MAQRIVNLIVIILVALRAEAQPAVLLISLDGFRWDYPQLTHTPVLDSISGSGTRAQALMPCFPSKTFVNHYTIATGLYPGNHGLIHNTFYHAPSGLTYSPSKRNMVEDSRFYAGEPIWVTARKHGLRTATLFWVGSEAPVGGYYPDIWKPYDESLSYAARIDTVVSWFSQPSECRPDLVTLYFDEPDATAHRYGPTHTRTLKKVREMDRLLGILMHRLARLPQADSLHVLVVSDHGMAATSRQKCLFLSDYVAPGHCQRVLGSNPVFFIDSSPERYADVYSALRTLPHVRVWTRDSIPAALFPGSKSLLPEFVVVADSGWSLLVQHTDALWKGEHGYDPVNTDMWGIFYATGPRFSSGRVIPAMRNTEVYNLIAHILRIAPAPNDGQEALAKSVLCR